MVITKDRLIERDRAKLDANITEARRQMVFAGSRLGVFARLRELNRDRKRIARRLIERDPERQTEYVQHLF